MPDTKTAAPPIRAKPKLLIRLFIPHLLPLDEMQTNYPWTKKEDGIAGGDSCYFQQVATARY
jgi:hypothetical protein